MIRSANLLRLDGVPNGISAALNADNQAKSGKAAVFPGDDGWLTSTDHRGYAHRLYAPSLKPIVVTTLS